jgi:hypothetical protein
MAEVASDQGRDPAPSLSSSEKEGGRSVHGEGVHASLPELPVPVPSTASGLPVDATRTSTNTTSPPPAEEIEQLRSHYEAQIRSLEAELRRPVSTSSDPAEEEDIRQRLLLAEARSAALTHQISSMPPSLQVRGRPRYFLV